MMLEESIFKLLLNSVTRDTWISLTLELINIRDTVGLKKRIINLSGSCFEEKFSERIICSWQVFCDCQNCRNKWTLFEKLRPRKPFSLGSKCKNKR